MRWRRRRRKLGHVIDDWNLMMRLGDFGTFGICMICEKGEDLGGDWRFVDMLEQGGHQY